MTILLMEGFELNALGQLTYSGAFDFFAQSATVRAGGGGVKSLFFRTTNNNFNQVVNFPFTAQDEVFIKMAFNCAAVSLMRLDFYNQAGSVVGSYTTGTGAGTICGQTVTGSAFSNSTWHAIDVYIKIHATTGRVTIRKDAVVVFDVENVDTTQSGVNTGINAFRIIKPSNSGTVDFYIDDIVVNNADGSVNNGFLPDVRIVGLTPTSDSTYNEMTPSAGTDHYAVVDEIPASTADYLESSTAGERELFGMSDLTLPSGWGILALQSMGYQHETVATGTFYSEFGTRIGGTDRWETDNQHLFSTTGAYIRSKIYEENPDTAAAWTDSDVDGLVAGIRIAP